MSQTAADQISLERIVNCLGGGVLCCKNDAVLTIIYASDSFYQRLGYEDGEITALLGEKPNRLLVNSPPVDWKKLAVSIKQNLLIEIELRLMKKDGSHVWMNCHMRLMVEDDGSEYFCGMVSDIGEKRRLLKGEREQAKVIKRAQMELAANEERYRIIMEQAADPICDYNFKTQELYCSPPFKEIFGLDVGVEGLLEQLCHSDLVFDEDRTRIIEDIYGIIDGTKVKNPEYRLKNADGGYRWFRVRCTVMRDKRGTPVRMIAFITDIDKQKKEHMVLKEKAEHDLLTGLYNGVTAAAMIDKKISQKNRGNHALLVIDIDNFKNINDSHGHLAGDKVIVDIATKIKNQFREGDIVSRTGGDEFVVFLKDITLGQVKKKCELLQQAFHSACPQGDKGYRSSASIGAAFYPRDGENYYELFRKADIAMYAAKSSGKDACCVYDPGLVETLRTVNKEIDQSQN